MGLDRYVWGAVCERCHLHTTPADSARHAVGYLVRLHRERDENIGDCWPCEPGWELVKVKVTPPVGEWRYPASAVT